MPRSAPAIQDKESPGDLSVLCRSNLIDHQFMAGCIVEGINNQPKNKNEQEMKLHVFFIHMLVCLYVQVPKVDSTEVIMLRSRESSELISGLAYGTVLAYSASTNRNTRYPVLTSTCRYKMIWKCMGRNTVRFFTEY